MSISSAIMQLKSVIRDSHLNIVSISERGFELRGHNRNNLAIFPTLVYGALPLVGMFYFWKRKGAEIIVGLCALLFTIVLVVRIMSLVNTKKSFILYDHAEARLSFGNAEVKKVGIRTLEIERIESSLTLITNSRYAHKKWYTANVDLFSSDGAKYTVAQFDAKTLYRPTGQAKALGGLFAAYLKCPYTHSEEMTVL